MQNTTERSKEKSFSNDFGNLNNESSKFFLKNLKHEIMSSLKREELNKLQSCFNFLEDDFLNSKTFLKKRNLCNFKNQNFLIDLKKKNSKFIKSEMICDKKINFLKEIKFPNKKLTKEIKEINIEKKIKKITIEKSIKEIKFENNNEEIPEKKKCEKFSNEIIQKNDKNTVDTDIEKTSSSNFEIMNPKTIDNEKKVNLKIKEILDNLDNWMNKSIHQITLPEINQ